MKLTPEQIAGWRRIFTLLDTLAEPLPPPPTDLLTYPQLRHLFFNMLANALDRQLSLRKSALWIAANLRPAKTKRLWVYGLKHACDHAYQRLGGACYTTETDFTACLRRQGLVVQDGYVRAKEVQP